MPLSSLDPHPLGFIYDAGLFGCSAESVCCTFTPFFLHHRVGHVNSQGTTTSLISTLLQKKSPIGTPWKIFFSCNPTQMRNALNGWGLEIYSLSLASPLYSVHSNGLITSTCAFDLPSGEVASNSLPITFANVAPILPPVRTWMALPVSPVPLMLLLCQHFLHLLRLYPIPPIPSYFSSNMSPDPVPVMLAYSQLYDFNWRAYYRL